MPKLLLQNNNSLQGECPPANAGGARHLAGTVSEEAPKPSSEIFLKR
jgi:hypothetical protein